jgi:hypothetical protein
VNLPEAGDDWPEIGGRRGILVVVQIALPWSVGPSSMLPHR